MTSDDGLLSRAQGCLLGQLCGDALGAIVEFMDADQIRARYPEGVRHLIASPVHKALPGQLTDDSEMALALARSLVARGEFDTPSVRNAYLAWLESQPPDAGGTVLNGLIGMHNPGSQANGALMRVSPLGIFGARHSVDDVARWAEEEAAITHVHPVCQDASALFAAAIAETIREGLTRDEVYARMLRRAKETRVDGPLLRVVHEASDRPPAEYHESMGWVLIAFQNALWQLLHAPSLEEALVDTVMRGGDTDTNAAVCGALLGAVYGRSAIPRPWEEAVLACRPERGKPGVEKPRPREYWGIDALDLAAKLVGK